MTHDSAGIASEVRLYAVVADGAQALPPPAGASDVHELLDDQPLGIYEGMRTFGPGRLLGLDRHMDRVDRSMELLGWGDRLDRPRLRRALQQALAAWTAGDARVRFDVLAQPPKGLATDSRLLLALSPHDEPTPAALAAGVSVGVAWTKHRDRPRIKQARWVVERRGTGPGDRGFYEHLLVDQDDGILECSSANFFAVRDTALVTAGSGMLEGVTRGFVLELAAALAIPVELRAPRLGDIETFDEAFLTSASRNCIPVVAVEGRGVGRGSPGPLTARLRLAYAEMARRDARPPLALSRGVAVHTDAQRDPEPALTSRATPPYSRCGELEPLGGRSQSPREQPAAWSARTRDAHFDRTIESFRPGT